MSRLDRHVSMVQNKLALARFVEALAWASVVYAGLIWVGLVIDRMFQVRLPHVEIWIWAGAGAAVLAALVYAVVKRPSAHDAAVAIDQRLELKEKFSTALFARSLKDEFADAAVKDAERTAENVSLSRRFPLEFPRQGLGTIGIAILVVLTMAFLPRMDLFGREAARVARTEQAKQVEEARKAVENNLKVIVDAQAKSGSEDEAVRQAKLELQKLLQAPIRDPEKAKLTAARALSDVADAIKQQIGNNQKVADAENDSKAFKSLTPSQDDKGPVADAQRKIADGKFADAVTDLEKAVDKFDKMTDEEKKKAADQMQNMAKQLQQMANPTPQQQQQMQQQLQQAGLNQKQAQQAQQLMQQAAQGNQQAQQQLQQMAQQAMKQMNNGQGPNQQQQQQMQQMMKQMQAQANTQAQAQQMAQAAKQMGQAMQQARGGQQGNQQGQQGSKGQQQAAQQMQQGQAAMNQQLQAMQAMKADAQQVAAAQAAAAQAAADAAAGLNNGGNNPGQQQGKGNWQGGNPGQFAQNNGKWNGQPGQPGGGKGAGDRTFKEQAPYSVKQEISDSQDIEGGKILASSMIKASSNKGESKVAAQTVTAPPAQDATDEVEQERISRPAQEAVKNYFSAWQKDAGGDATGGSSGQ